MVITNRKEWSPIVSVIIQVIKKNQTTAKWETDRETDLLITSTVHV